MIKPRSSTRAVLSVAALTLTGAACGDDDNSASPTTTTPATETTAPGAETTAAPTSPTAAAAVELPDACTLVPTADVIALTELAVDEGVLDGNDVRSVCTFRDVTNGVGITIGVQADGRFEPKADQSRSALDDDGEEITSLGDRALFFFSDEDLPEGVGGTLVGVGDLTIEVTMQGLDEDAMRDASTALADLAVDNL